MRWHRFRCDLVWLGFTCNQAKTSTICIWIPSAQPNGHFIWNFICSFFFRFSFCFCFCFVLPLHFHIHSRLHCETRTRNGFCTFHSATSGFRLFVFCLSYIPLDIDCSSHTHSRYSRRFRHHSSDRLMIYVPSSSFSSSSWIRLFIFAWRRAELAVKWFPGHFPFQR